MNKVNDPVITQSMLNKALEKNNQVLTKTIIDEVAGIIDIFATRIDERFNRLEERMDRVEASLDKLTTTIDGFVKRLDQIAVETGVRLKDFTK